MTWQCQNDELDVLGYIWPNIYQFQVLWHWVWWARQVWNVESSPAAIGRVMFSVGSKCQGHQQRRMTWDFIWCIQRAFATTVLLLIFSRVKQSLMSLVNLFAQLDRASLRLTIWVTKFSSFVLCKLSSPIKAHYMWNSLYCYKGLPKSKMAHSTWESSPCRTKWMSKHSGFIRFETTRSFLWL